MILAAGLGTRLKPFTDKHPKALAMVNGKSLLQRNVEYLQQFGITEVIVNVHHFADQITGAIKKNNGWGSTISISDETNEVLETGGGLQKAGWFFDDDFVLMNVDILTDLDLQVMIDQHKKNNALATLAVTERNTSRYFLFDRQQQLCGWRNIKTGEEKIMRNENDIQQKAFSGIHVIDPKIFSLIQQQGKFSMVDVYLSLCANHSIQYFDHTASKFIDVGKPESIAEAEKMFA
ncbi:D-glycero-alpha-D-manno-heptose 1-phosphate guanylyltransferase [mine drainage metagenome]|uniref:D-glycero-alpha-D-manno-heptose 1-phosphate guanylyltransferase n=1 Tax=mine drainage metagenome TaxID=410659 RepID=A0A1J5SUP0_9ZZZZ